MVTCNSWKILVILFYFYSSAHPENTLGALQLPASWICQFRDLFSPLQIFGGFKYVLSYLPRGRVGWRLGEGRGMLRRVGHKGEEVTKAVWFMGSKPVTASRKARLGS